MKERSQLNLVHSLDMNFLRGCFFLTEERKKLFTSLGAIEILASAESKYQAWSSICDYVQSHGLMGAVLRNAESNQWCVITPDPEPGLYRYTGFDKRGFYMHGQYPKPESALLEVFRMGFRFIECESVLEALSSAPEWLTE